MRKSTHHNGGLKTMSLISEYVKDLRRFMQKQFAVNFYWRKDAAGRLAELIVLDQFSRTMFRDTPQSFANDSLALALSQEAISAGTNQKLNPIQRSFL